MIELDRVEGKKKKNEQRNYSEKKKERRIEKDRREGGGMEATNNPMICAHLCKNIIYDVVNYCDSFRADYQEERDSRLI